MATPQATKNLRERKEIVDLQMRGLAVKRAFLHAGHEKFMPFIIAQAMNERIDLSNADRLRISQLLNGNIGPDDAHLLAICERTLATVKRSRKAAA